VTIKPASVQSTEHAQAALRATCAGNVELVVIEGI